jgi:hypothetical protein
VSYCQPSAQHGGRSLRDVKINKGFRDITVTEHGSNVIQELPVPVPKAGEQRARMADLIILEGRVSFASKRRRYCVSREESSTSRDSLVISI